MNHTPTKAQWQVVIDNLKKVLPLATREDHLNMGYGGVNTWGHVCGTMHCVGGWYAVATLDKRQELTYEDGVLQMSKDLGFTMRGSFYVIRRWASNNPTMWGNDDGAKMFLFPSAYYHKDKRPNGALNLQHVIDHFEEVRDRSPD